jgi:cobalamin biosynthesis protein CobW
MEPLGPTSDAVADTVVGLVVSGFLGAGKTTLVRQLLEAGRRDGIPTAVVSNELGELGIDRALLAGAADIVELEGGCVCCRLGDELVRTLSDLRARTKPRRVIVETSGAALPYETLLHFWREPVRDWFEDDASVVVVNAEQVREGRDLAGTFEDQVASADLLVVNKMDLVSPADTPRIERVLRDIEPDAPILHAVAGNIDPQVLFPPESAPKRRRRRHAGTASPPPLHDHDRFDCDELVLDGPLPATELERRLAGLDALRIKGFAQTPAGLVLVQGVGRRISVTPTRLAAPPGAVGRLVVIRRK